MKNTTVATIDAHSPARYCVLLCLCGGSIVSQNTAHLTIPVLGRGMSDLKAYPSCKMETISSAQCKTHN